MEGVSLLEPYIDSFDAAPGYLDWAAFGPLSPSVRAEMSADAEVLGTGRRSGVDLVGERVGEARERVARLLGAATDDVVLQPSTTQGLFHALFGLDGTVVVPAQDFPAVRVSAHRAAAARGRLTVREIDPPEGIVTVDAIRAALTDDVSAVALSLVDFRTGALVDLAELRARAKDVMNLADRYEVPVLTPRDAHAGIVTLLPVPQDAATLAAALANHGVTVTARGATIRVAPHVGTGADTLRLLGDALADAAAQRVHAVIDFDRADLAADLVLPEIVEGDPSGDDLPELAADTGFHDDEYVEDLGDDDTDEDIVIAIVDEPHPTEN